MIRVTDGKYINKSCSVNVRIKHLFFLIFFSGIGFLIASVIRWGDIHYSIPKALKDLYYQNIREFTIKTDGCLIPALELSDEFFREYIKYPTNLSCPNSGSSLLKNNRTRIWVQRENFYHYNISNNGNVTCCYQSFVRPRTIHDIMSRRIDHRVKYSQCSYFNDVIIVQDEFVKVSCFAQRKIIDVQFFLFAPKKKFIVHNKPELSLNAQAYNILVLGIDGLSRLNFHRTMPKTATFLKSKGGIELAGYNKVGDNTFPNLIPMLMGVKDTELKNMCLPYFRSTFDNCPFIWEWYKQAGYYTAFGEDTSHLGTFNYFKEGFSRQPTDYYIHTFIHEAESNVGKNKNLNTFLCMNNRYFYEILLNYIQDLTTTLIDKKMFGFFWEVTMTHDYLNYPMVIDDNYRSFFNELDQKGYLNDAIIFLVSDHGMRWGHFRLTKQGRIEERLPILMLLTPPSFRNKYTAAYNNLKLNSNRLSTPFDLYETLSDLLNMNNLKDDAILSRSKKNSKGRGTSLFLPIPSNRTCKTANIDDHWCTCQQGKSLPVDGVEAIDTAVNLVREINFITKEHQECARLILDKILDLKEMHMGIPDKNENDWREFMITVRTMPGGGVFEATLRNNSQHWALSGTISRLNLYGDQSYCVQNYILKLYCYCIEHY
ncbi:hypothetical protein K1T71_002731 [Dendrolimus kikuchii]|uniref:Uncharacterized protein n=1 Tax=Dendrolimus kikuchii TaxID=765133 RepID=A0ACC1DDI5_9NEOP|nr:hypothetical protein K1T71_002731 [Dendrolimus kikuchii]